MYVVNRNELVLMASKTVLVLEHGKEQSGRIHVRSMYDVVVENVDAVRLCNYGYTPSQ